MEMKSIALFLFIVQAILNIVILSEPLYADIFRCKKDSGSFLPNSTYENELLAAFKTLSTFVRLGTDSARTGQIYATSVCAGYLKIEACKSCVNNIIPLLLKSCPKIKQAFAWRSKCMVQYGPVRNVIAYDSWFFAHETSNIKAKDLGGLEKTMITLVEKLSEQAAYVDRNTKYAYGTMPYGSRQTLFMVMQCTTDIVPEDCLKCLQVRVYGEMKSCCSGATAAATLTSSCYMRYAHDDFRSR
ncbi:putative Gnk2-like domain-containing protein [Helianthus debilis subsp. tardiflorus]